MDRVQTPSVPVSAHKGQGKSVPVSALQGTGYKLQVYLFQPLQGTGYKLQESSSGSLCVRKAFWRRFDDIHGGQKHFLSSPLIHALLTTATSFLLMKSTIVYMFPSIISVC